MWGGSRPRTRRSSPTLAQTRRAYPHPTRSGTTMSEREFERNAMRHTLRNALPGMALAATVLASVTGLGGALSGLTKNRATIPDSAPVMPGLDRTASTTDANRTLAALPLRFEPNHGQTAAEVDFLCRAGGGTVFTQPAA